MTSRVFGVGLFRVLSAYKIFFSAIIIYRSHAHTYLQIDTPSH